MFKSFLLFSLILPSISFAQVNFWHGSLNKCQVTRKSCLAFKNAGCQASGQYKIDPDGPGGNAAFTAYCDQKTDGGGWTLVAYAGTITTSKLVTTGSSNFQPLFNNYGTYNPNSLSTKATFSRFDLLKSLASNSSRFLVRRTSVPNNMISFDLINTAWWAGTTVTPATCSAITPRTAVNLKMTNTGESGWATKSGAFWTWSGSGASQFQGISWNVTDTYENCDTGTCSGTRSIATSLNRRSILYWSSDNGGTHDTLQWFHACPMTLNGCTGPINNYQDFEFYFRE